MRRNELTAHVVGARDPKLVVLSRLEVAGVAEGRPEATRLVRIDSASAEGVSDEFEVNLEAGDLRREDEVMRSRWNASKGVREGTNGSGTMCSEAAEWMPISGSARRTRPVRGAEKRRGKLMRWAGQNKRPRR